MTLRVLVSDVILEDKSKIMLWRVHGRYWAGYSGDESCIVAAKSSSDRMVLYLEDIDLQEWSPEREMGKGKSF